MRRRLLPMLPLLVAGLTLGQLRAKEYDPKVLPRKDVQGSPLYTVLPPDEIVLSSYIIRV